MKKHLTLALSLISVSFVFGQGAEELLSKASANIKAQKYQEALMNISDAKSAVSDLLAKQLSAALPASVGEWKIKEESENSEMMGMGNPNEIGTVQVYTLPKSQEDQQVTENNSDMAMPDNMATPEMYGEGESKVRVTISNNAMMANEVMMAHSGQEMYNSEGETKVLKIKRYRALERFDRQNQMGNLIVIVGAGVVVIDLESYDDNSIMQSFAEAINYDVIKSVLGE